MLGRAGLLAGVVFLSLVASVADADVDGRIGRGRFAIGLNSPGVGLRYFLLNRYCLEIRSQFEPGVLVPGARICRYSGPLAGIFPYFGVEGAYAQYKGDEATGVGYAGAAFLGGEYYVFKRISVQIDFGPGYVSLDDKEYDVDVSGIEFVVNAGLNYYFGRARRSPSAAESVERVKEIDGE